MNPYLTDSAAGGLDTPLQMKTISPGTFLILIPKAEKRHVGPTRDIIKGWSSYPKYQCRGTSAKGRVSPKVRVIFERSTASYHQEGERKWAENLPCELFSWGRGRTSEVPYHHGRSLLYPLRPYHHIHGFLYIHIHHHPLISLKSSQPPVSSIFSWLTSDTQLWVFRLW